MSPVDVIAPLACVQWNRGMLPCQSGICFHQQHQGEDQEEISGQLHLALPKDDPSCGWTAIKGIGSGSCLDLLLGMPCFPHQWQIE
jgi:hypothetical protein